MTGDDTSQDGGGAEGLGSEERAVLAEATAWIRDHEEELLELLAELVARPSVTGSEGTHDDPDTVVGTVHSFLSAATERARLDARSVDAAGERENCYAVLEGASDELFLCTSHTDTVAPGDPADWPDGEPYRVTEGRIRRTEPGRLAIEVDGHGEERAIREAYDAVWERREREERTALVGRGVYDNKASVVCLVGALVALERACAERDVELDGTVVHGHLVGEEVSQVGAKAMAGWGDRPGWLPEQFPDPEGAVVVVDGSYGFVPAVGHRGLAWVTLRADGESTHASTPHLGRNAVLETANVLSTVEDEPFRDAIREPFAEDELLGELTVAAGTTIVGGDVTRDSAGSIERAGVNAVPAWCETTFDVRMPRWEGYPDDLDGLREHLERTIERHAREHADAVSFRADVDPEEFFSPVAVTPSLERARDHPLVARALRAAESTVGYDPGVTVAPGVTDAAVLAPTTGLPTLVEYGPAGAFSHEPLEFVERDSVADGAAVVAELAVRQLGLAR